MRVLDFDHLVLVVSDVDRSLAFYCGRLGLSPEREQQWRAGEAPFPSVRITPTTVIDLVQGHRGEQNVDHLCLVVDELDWDGPVREGPVQRWGARGLAQSLYVEDPDGNLVELRRY